MFAGRLGHLGATSILTACGILLVCYPAFAHWRTSAGDRNGDGIRYHGHDRRGNSGWGTGNSGGESRGYSRWGPSPDHGSRRDNNRRFGPDRMRHGGRHGHNQDSTVDRRRPVNVVAEPEESQPTVDEIPAVLSNSPVISTIPIASSGNPGSTNLIVVNVNSSPQQTPAG
ncbi:hypothetical protein RvY_13269 [Ramazzottius varieornatus]|uniref:Uncharacterized protein n=1 Tax=Ramazzottius varieornatus TaxID=947166 RepID=A0A1D1VMA0_RAMVA|nr:hypothetical protein RvY_13269 [Ramazzottius varieornatus]